MSINMPQLIFQRAESAPPLPSQMSHAALSGGQSLREGGGGETFAWGKGGTFSWGGSQVSHPPYETLCSYVYFISFLILLPIL